MQFWEHTPKPLVWVATMESCKQTLLSTPRIIANIMLRTAESTKIFYCANLSDRVGGIVHA